MEINFNLHPQQVAQSTSLSHTNGETGTSGNMNGTDDNTNKDGLGPSSDDGLSASEGSEDVAVEFAEDPIEKTRRRNQPHRAIPDRAKLEDMRE